MPKTENVRYKAVGSIDPLWLPDNTPEIVFDDFVIRECPNHEQPVLITDEHGDALDCEWAPPAKIDPSFPETNYYVLVEFKAPKGHGWVEAENRIRWALTRMRLFKRGFLWGGLHKAHMVDSPGIRVGMEDISHSLRRRPTKPPSRMGMLHQNRYEVLKEEIDDLRTYVNNLRTVPPPRSHELAFRRFDSSFDRDTPSDQAIDLFIALESLLSDDREAIGYKIALRGALLLEEDGTARQKLASFLNSAYGKRSKIVHGASKSDDWLLQVKDYPVRNIIQLEDTVRRLLRLLLTKAQQGVVLDPRTIDRHLFFS